MIKIKYYFLVLSQLFMLVSFSQTKYYVSPKGNDHGSGTAKSPFKTISRAMGAVKKINHREKDIAVILSSGTYFIDHTLHFGPEDAGSKTHQVTYRAAELGTVIISGGKKVSNWKESEYPGVYQAHLSSEKFRQLYVEDRKAIRARYPNSGFNRTNSWDARDRKLILRKDFTSMLADTTNVEIVLLQSWADSYLRVKQTNINGVGNSKFTEVSFKNPESEILFNRPYPQLDSGLLYYFENSLQLLDNEDEWFYDQNEQKLYYKPMVSEKPNNLEIIYPYLDTLIAIKGKPKKPVRNLVFEGLIFKHSSWTEPSKKGYIDGQTGLYNVKSTPDNEQYVARPPAAVYIENARNVVFERNRFHQLGATAIDLAYGTKNCVVKGNMFKNISGTGVMVGKFTQDENTEFHMPYNPKDKDEVSRNDTISNNFIQNVATDYYGCVGIAAGYPSGIQITHNVVKDLPYTGISVGYGWTDQPNAMSDNLIAYNDISNVMKIMNDGAGIYTLSLQPGTRIYRNYIHDIPMATYPTQTILGGIYCDEASGGTEENPMIIEENIITYGYYQKLKTHKPTVIVIKYNIHGIRQKNGQEIIKHVGLEDQYLDILID